MTPSSGKHHLHVARRAQPGLDRCMSGVLRPYEMAEYWRKQKPFGLNNSVPLTLAGRSRLTDPLRH